MPMPAPCGHEGFSCLGMGFGYFVFLVQFRHESLLGIRCRLLGLGSRNFGIAF